ncbi:MAG TPA: DNA polymerase III subunit beta [Opitutales bacterium]|nr:DNA polymerase III subunit beta [Opitutales bacterium]
MRFTINRDYFANGLSQVLNVVGTRATMPILGNALIEAADGAVSLTTTNLDMSIRCRIKADVAEPGSITLPVRKLAAIVSDLPSLEVQVDCTAQQARLTSGTASFRIMGIASDEFPPLPTFADKHSFVLQQEDLSKMLKSVSYAESTDEARYIMNGVFFSFAENKLTMAATDGRRLAVIIKEMSVGDENAGSIILPARTVAEVMRLCGSSESVRIAFNERQVAFEIASGSAGGETGLTDSIYLVSKVVEGNYPNYKQVIPKETDQHVRVSRETFLNTVRRASRVTSDKNNSVKVNVKPGVIDITGSSDIGESKVSVNVEYTGPDITVAFNPQYLMDPLKALTRDEVIFEFKDELSPGVIRTPDGFMCVIMPLRIS